MTGGECDKSKSVSTGRMAVVGMFDGVHLGHRFLLDALKAEASRRGLAPLSVTFSNHPLEIISPAKAPLLLTGSDEKRAFIAGEGVETVVMPFDGRLRDTSSADFLLMLKREYGVEAMLLGFNNRFGHDAPRDFGEYCRLGRECGVEIVQAPEFQADGSKVSSSEIRRLVSSGDVAEASRLLGRPYSVSGTVGHGHAIGRTIGFPTANLNVDPRRLLPAEGVYAAEALLPDGERHGAVVNIGRRPTVEGNNKAPISVEAHIIGYSGDLYGAPLTLSFVARIRPERKFSSLETLKAGIAADLRAATDLLSSHRLY